MKEIKIGAIYNAPYGTSKIIGIDSDGDYIIKLIDEKNPCKPNLNKISYATKEEILYFMNHSE